MKEFNMQKIMILQAIASQTDRQAGRQSYSPYHRLVSTSSPFSGAFYLRIITVVVLVLVLALDLKLVRNRGLLATFNIFIDGVENAGRGSCTASASTDTAGCDGHEVGKSGLESAALAAAAAELLAGGGSGGCGLFTGLELEEGLLFGGGSVFEENDAAGGLRLKS
jgi:hypothetical protein